MNAALNDPYLVPLVLFCAAVIAIGAIVTVLHRVPRVEFAQSKNEFEKLSERVRVLGGGRAKAFRNGAELSLQVHHQREWST